MLRAMEMLTKARLQGAKPAMVMVMLGNAEQFPWWKDGTTVEIVIPDDKALVRMDFRALVGCDVVVIAPDRGERTKLATERICAQANRVTVLSGSDPDELGHVWVRDQGWRKFGEGEAV